MSTAPLAVPARAAAKAKAPVGVLMVSSVATVVFCAIVLGGLGGWSYYTTPGAIRGYSAAHGLLRPAGRLGHLFGVGGFILMLIPIIYSVRKNVRRFKEAGSMKTWLDVHIFAGIIGPVLVTFHTSFKFNGVVSVAYWSMVVVVLSGFVGRYLFVRIPRSLRGLELTQAEVDAQARDLSDELVSAALPPSVLSDIDAFERRVSPPGDHVSYLRLFIGDLHMRREIRRARKTIGRHGIAPDLHEQVIALAAERATLARRVAYLQKTRRLFEIWHVFHMPLVYVMFAIVAVHVFVTVRMGYVPFMD